MRHLILGCLLFATTPSLATEAPAVAPTSKGILLTGDSMMRVGVAAVLRKTLPTELGEEVTTHAKSATGLARPDSYDWLTELPKLIKDQHYATAIVALGSNDCQNLTQLVGKTVNYGTKDWETTYRARVKQMIELLCASADEVLWLGLPPMRNAKFNGRVTALNALLASEVGAAECATFLPIAPKLGDAKGHFTQFVKVGKHKQRVREDDGIHLTQNGGRLVSELIVESLKK